MDESKQPGLRIAQIFLQSAQFRHRDDALALPADTRPGETSLQVQIRVMGFKEKNAAAVSLRAATDPEDKDTLYQFSVEMMALVEEMPGQENMPAERYVAQMGSTLLFPFLRESVANLTMRGRFGPIWLKPFNLQAVIAGDKSLVEA